MKLFSCKTVSVFIIAFCCFSCTKKIDDIKLSPLEASAQNTLETKMSKEDFANLNWEHANVKTLNGKELFVEIPTISNDSKKLVYSKDGQNELYNYYELQIISSSNMQLSGSLVLSAIDNTVLHTYSIGKNKILKSVDQNSKSVNALSVRSHGLSDLFLPDVTVYATITNNSNIFVNYISLYWLFNGWSNYTSLYANSGDQAVMDANAPISGQPAFYNVNVTTLQNGLKQYFFNNKDAFAVSGLDITFNIDPATNTLVDQSVVTTPMGGGRLGAPASVFIGAWSQTNITDIYKSGNIIDFTINARNSVNLGSGTVTARYSLTVEINLANNTATVTWN